ncbi:unnamed protein product [Diplocarpon coronariae]
MTRLRHVGLDSVCGFGCVGSAHRFFLDFGGILNWIDVQEGNFVYLSIDQTQLSAVEKLVGKPLVRAPAKEQKTREEFVSFGQTRFLCPTRSLQADRTT